MAAASPHRPNISSRRDSGRDDRTSRVHLPTARRSALSSGHTTLVNDNVSASDLPFTGGKRNTRTRLSSDSSFTSFYETGKTHWGAPTSPRDNGFVDEGDMPYPADELGAEMAPNARVWRVYMDEATRFDNDMIDRWNRSLDVLLVFAGLFSGVITTFAVQSSQNSEPNYAQVSALLQQQMLAVMQGTPVDPTSAPSVISSQITGQSQWINVLWFTSLACSLSSAFLSMLVKQWLQEYQSDISGTPQDRTRLRQYRYAGLNTWQVPAIVSALPVLLHISLLFFFVGFVLFLWSFDQTSATPVLAIGAIVFLGYLATILLPIVYPQCPYVTSVSINLLKLFTTATVTLSITIRRVSHAVQTMTVILNCTIRGNKRHLRQSQVPHHKPLVPAVNPRKSAELQAISVSVDVVDGNAITWLFSMSTDKSVVESALCAIAGLTRGSAAVEVLNKGGAFPLVDSYFRACFPSTKGGESCSLQQLSRAACYGRAWMHLADLGDPDNLCHSGAPIRQKFAYLAETRDPDYSVIGACALIQFYGSGLSAVRQSLDLLTQSIQGDLNLKPYTLGLLLDTIAWTAIKWAVPAYPPRTVDAVPIFIRLIHSLQPDPSSSLARIISNAFAPFVEPFCQPDGPPFGIQTTGSTLGTRELLVRELMRVTGQPDWYGLDNVHELSWAVQEVARILLDGLNDHPNSKGSKMASYIVESISELSLRFLLRRLCPDSSADQVLPDVFQLFLQSPYDLPLEDARFLSTLAQVLRTSQDSRVVRRAILLIKRCIAESSEIVLRAFVDCDGLSSLFRHFTPSSVHREPATALLRAFFVGVALMCRRRTENIECLLDAIFRTKTIDTVCLAAEENGWTLSETHSWLSSFLVLCHSRPDDPVWPNVISSFSVSVHNLVEDGENCVDESSAQIYGILHLQLRELRRIACLEGGEFDYRMATSMVPFFAPVSTDISGEYELATVQSSRPYGILSSLV